MRSRRGLDPWSSFTTWLDVPETGRVGSVLRHCGVATAAWITGRPITAGRLGVGRQRGESGLVLCRRRHEPRFFDTWLLLLNPDVAPALANADVGMYVHAIGGVPIAAERSMWWPLRPIRMSLAPSHHNTSLGVAIVVRRAVSPVLADSVAPAVATHRSRRSPEPVQNVGQRTAARLLPTRR